MTSAQWHKLHRRIGIIVVVFILLLSASGFLLNHSGQLNLHKNYIQINWLLNWYDIGPKQPAVAFRAGDDWVSRVGKRLYFNNLELNEESELLLGAVESNDVIIVGLKRKLLLLTQSGELIEKLSVQEGVPAGMQAIGMDINHMPLVKTANGIYLVDIDNLVWEEYDNINTEWSSPGQLPQDLLDQLLQLYRGKGLPLERVLLDLHSGRILGDFGVYLVDASP